MTIKKEPTCDGNCDECPNGTACSDEFCKQHSGNTVKINTLMDRVGDLEDRDSQVDNLTGRVNILINICLIIIAAIVGDFAHSVTVNKKFEIRYTQDRLQLKDTIHELDNKLMARIDTFSRTISDQVDDMADQMDDRFDDLSDEADKRFDLLERELPLMEKDIGTLKEQHLNGRK